MYGTSEFSTRSARRRLMNSDPAELCGIVSSARRRDDGVDDATDAGLRLSTATILPRWNMVEEGTAHG